MTISPRFKSYLWLSVGCICLMLVMLAIWVFQLDRELRSRIEGQWFLPPVEIYSAPVRIHPEQTLSPMELRDHLLALGFRQREPHLRLFPGDFSLWDRQQCQVHLTEALSENVSTCVTMLMNRGLPATTAAMSLPPQLMTVAFTTENRVGAVFSGEPLRSQSQIELDSHLFAQFYGGKPILRRLVQIGDVPLYCLQGVTAIEDSDFLEHRGVSPAGLFRALIKNLAHGRYAQGGSTITQQLIKVYFLTSKKTLKRKITELIMAVLLETRVEKDKILSNYLNAIYMAQNGPFQVVGFGAAAQHYFQKPIEELNLSECALLAAIVNSPGRYNPFTSPQNALARRKKVLARMAELQMIDRQMESEANQQSLPSRPPHSLTDPAPYFVQAIEREIQTLGIDDQSGLRIFTTLDEASQEAAQRSISQNLQVLEKTNKLIAQEKTQGKELQASLVAVEVGTGHVIALVGGRSYKRTQFNRALDGHRQVGSIMKPFVYLTALENRTPEGDPYTPLTPIEDQAFTFKYQGQSWSPVNYDKKFLGTIPMFAGLKNSINSATAKLGLEVGLEAIIDVARRAGIQSPIAPVPSLTLGSFELFPLEVAESYLTLSRMGKHVPLVKISRIENLDGQILFQSTSPSESRFAPENIAVLVGMMKQTVLAGTARSLAFRGFTDPAAGKTGTTSDFKDAWFAGFTPEVLTVVWVGFDDNSTSGLTGASGALPIWADFMKDESLRHPIHDFDWPEGTVVYHLPIEKYNSLLTTPEDLPVKDFPLVFRSGEQPTE